MAMIPLATPADLKLAESAVNSLMQELAAYPKPGLVSRVDSGAHADMDYDLMSRSARALLLPFVTISSAGRNAASFQKTLIPRGLTGEKEMLLATGGINTHRGAIFSLGMILASLALTQARSEPMTPERVRARLLETWGDELAAHAFARNADSSHGAAVRETTGAGGARIEAARGYPGIFEIGIPAYREALTSGLDSNASRIQTLFTLMEAVEDTNVIYRGGMDAATFVRQSARQFLAGGGCNREGWFERAEDLHREFIRRRLSPGGCADLLAGTLLVMANCLAN